MDLSFFLTTQTPQQNQGKILASLTQGQIGSATELGILFGKILQGQLDSHTDVNSLQSQNIMQQTSQEQILESLKNAGTDTSDLTSLLSDIAQAVETMLSGESSSENNVIDIQSMLGELSSTISLSLTNGQMDKVGLAEKSQKALLAFLTGTPLPAQNAVLNKGQSPFSNTEATQDELALFQTILQNLGQSEGMEIPQIAIIATGLSPAEMEAALQKAAVVLSEDHSSGEMSDDLIALLGVMQNLPQQTSLPPVSLAVSLQRTSGDGGAWQIVDNRAAFFPDGAADAAALPEAASFKATLATQEKVAADAGSKAANMMAGVANENAQVMPVTAGIALFTAEGMEWFDPITQEWTATPALPSAMAGTNLTSVITQAVSAQTAHPATQMIAATIQKNAANGEASNWRLQLEPPELGRVEVQLTFTKDKMVKAHMIVEKPETWLMLQRDAQVLERALQDAGLDAGAENLSFELADQGFDFSGNGSHDGYNGQGGGQNAEGEVEIIETTMTWFTDPETGLERYNLMV